MDILREIGRFLYSSYSYADDVPYFQEENNSMINIGLHARISGHPGRIIAILEFLDYLKSKPDIWITR